MPNIVKIAILPIIDRKLLLCRKKGLQELISLGGRLEKGESHIQCIKREVMEEAQCLVNNLAYFDAFEGPVVNDPNSKINLVCYFGTLVGNPKPNPKDNVIGFEWIDKSYLSKGYKLPPTLEKAVSKLVFEGYL